MNNPYTLTNTELGIAMDAIREQVIHAPIGVGCYYVDSRAILLKKLLWMYLDTNIPTGGEVECPDVNVAIQQ